MSDELDTRVKALEVDVATLQQKVGVLLKIAELLANDVTALKAGVR